MYELNNDIPIPTKLYGTRKGTTKYPHMRMEVGQSFFITPRSRFSSAYALARLHGKEVGKGFVARQEGDGWRIWRIK